MTATATYTAPATEAATTTTTTATEATAAVTGSREWRPPRPTDMHLTLAPLQHGSGDPSFRRSPDGSVWRASRTPLGPVTTRLRQRRDGTVLADAWGPGAPWSLEMLPELLGARDDDSTFDRSHRLLRDPARRFAGWRICRSGLVLESLVPVVLEQKVTGIEAKTSWRRLLLRFGEPAPRPAGAGADVPWLRLIPDARTWSRIPSWEWHLAGVGPERSRRIVSLATHAARLEATLDLPCPEAARWFRLLPGVGVWTAAEVLQRAHGDPDAVSFGDYHVAKNVTWALTGTVGDDAEMERLLEPWRGHRYRVCTLLALAGLRRPRHGPRMSPTDYRAI